jgi:hypothetical protein
MLPSLSFNKQITMTTLIFSLVLQFTFRDMVYHIPKRDWSQFETVHEGFITSLSMFLQLGTGLRYGLHTYIPLTLYPRRGSRDISDITLRRRRFTKII